MIRPELLVAVLLCGFGLWIFGTFAVCVVRSLFWQARNKRIQAMLPPVREAFVNFLAGTNNQDRLREFAGVSRPAVGTVLMSLAGTVAGTARDRLCDLALELALVDDWCEDARSRNALVRRTAFARLSSVCTYEPCRRVTGDLLFRALDDRDDEVKLSASRALVQSGTIDAIERVFDHTLSKNLLVRILLAEELRRHAVALCQRAIPKTLQSGDPVRILNMLQMAAGWERALPMPGMGGLLKAADRPVRMQALRLASMAADSPEIRKGILDALADPDPEVAACAADAAARQHLEAALPALARCLRLGNPDLARAAAAALVEIPRGLTTLQELSSSPNPVTAQAANEALARARVPE